MNALEMFERFVRKGVDETPKCTPILPGKASCAYDSGLGETSDGWIAGADAGDDVGGVGDGYYKGRLNLAPYTIATALSGGVFYAELYALSNASSHRPLYASIARGAVRWLLRKQSANGTIPYIISPPDPNPHEYQSITYSAEAFVDLHLRFGSAAMPLLLQLNSTVAFLLAKQGATGALLPDGTRGEIDRSARAITLLQWWYMNVEPSNERLAHAVSRYVVSWLQSEEGAAKEGVAARALSSGFIGLVAADLIQPWATFVRGEW